MEKTLRQGFENEFRLPEIGRKVLDYIDGRRLETGGFCYFKSWGSQAPSTLDTHAALLALSLLDNPEQKKWRSDEKTRRWLRERLLLELSFEDIVGVWHLCASLRLMGDRLSEEDRLLIFAFLKRTTRHFLHEQKANNEKKCVCSGSLSSLIAWNRLGDLSGWTGERPSPGVFFHDSEKTLIELFYRWEMNISGWYPGQMVPSCNRSLFENRLAGYVLVPGSTATDMAVIACGVLHDVKTGAGVSFSGSVLEWVQDSLSVSGGFGRIPGAVPDLLSTAQALLILDLLPEGGGCSEKLFPGNLWWSLQEY